MCIVRQRKKRIISLTFTDRNNSLDKWEYINEIILVRDTRGYWSKCEVSCVSLALLENMEPTHSIWCQKATQHSCWKDLRGEQTWILVLAPLSIQFGSVAQSCPTLCNPMDCSTPGLPVLHCLPTCSNSCALSWSYHPTISWSVTPFSSCPQSFPALESFPMSWFFPSSGQSIGVSASVLPMNIQGWFPLGLTSLTSLLYKRLSRVFYSTTVQKHPFFVAHTSLWSNSHICA